MVVVKCPTCGKPAQFSPENVFRPFCSERCQTLDLGAWADEKYKVPVSGQVPESVNENSDADEAEDEPLPPKDHFFV